MTASTTPSSSARNHALAQRYANAAWGWGLTAAVVFYLWGWAWAAIPILALLGSVWESFKATKKAIQWEKVEMAQSLDHTSRQAQ